ncbi:orotidine-5'-phosphate decarboxylase [Nakamurella leprariae]|uniref:Orotidine 5'-phosphate decarboxylase n=1 Tax=Nakamurella leprariae TaxID=2803911 RepID=A0A938YE90_9ACTN|nr:orotidine-5'-phosphate decarboxylase [Nakamurella leprariae]MBM9468229.1 orotidine-5'-phosphate decarboxylase [Nakamurella leprariae]
MTPPSTSPARAPFGARLAAAVKARGPLCVGIDPHPALLRAWDLPVTADGLARFTAVCLDALAPTVAVLKPQSAFYEQFGSAGIAVLERLLVGARQAGALVLLDAKRGDIGSTMQAYAAAYLADGSPLAADAVTVSPYLGFGSLQPAVDTALATGRGVFVLALTSNPEGPTVQHARAAGGRMVAQQIADEAAARNAGVRPLGSVGLVVGATVGRTGVDLSQVNGPLLAPGLGAQGATADDLRDVFGDALTAGPGSVLPTTSREVLGAGPSPLAMRDAALRQVDAIRAVMA